MSPHDRRIVLDKLPVSALSIPSQKKKKTALVALGGVLLVGCFLIVYNLAGYYRLRSRDALHTSRMEACEEAVLEGKISFWLKNMPDDKIVCQMYAEAYSEMVGEVGHGVPKIIHQSWKTVDVTDDFRIWLSSWREANPDHEHWFWTDEDNREMVARYYPQFLETYGTFRAVLPPGHLASLTQTTWPHNRRLSHGYQPGRLCPRVIHAPVRGRLCGPGHLVPSAGRFALLAGVSESVCRRDGPAQGVSTQHTECVVWIGAEPPILDLLLQMYRGTDDHAAG